MFGTWFDKWVDFTMNVIGLVSMLIFWAALLILIAIVVFGLVG